MTDAAPIWIGTSWKMNKTLAEARAFAEGLLAADAAHARRIQRFVIPPFTAVREVKAMLAATSVKVGAQNMHWADEGRLDRRDFAPDAEGLQSRSGRTWPFRTPHAFWRNRRDRGSARPKPQSAMA